MTVVPIVLIAGVVSPVEGVSKLAILNMLATYVVLKLATFPLHMFCNIQYVRSICRQEMLARYVANICCPKISNFPATYVAVKLLMHFRKTDGGAKHFLMKSAAAEKKTCTHPPKRIL